MNSFDYNTYLSPFTWRYGSEEMRKIWSEVYKRKLWRKIWVELAKAQHKEGLVSKSELEDLVSHQENVDIEKAHEIEKEIHHDLMAEIKTYAAQAKKGGGKIHLGATSMDIEDNADILREKEALALVEGKLKFLIKSFVQKIDHYKNLPCMAYTHLQPAEPTTLGYRFSLYAQDLLFDLYFLHFAKTMLKGKGIKGAVGTSASYSLLLDNKKKAEEMEKTIMKNLGLETALIASQTSPRKSEFFLASLLSSIAQSLYKFAFDVRIMQSPGFSEWQEPFGKKQVGSSAMPFKRNPIKSEQICSLAKLVFHLASVAKDNASQSLLERTLDDSANRRVFIPEMFLAVDAMLISTNKIIDELVIKEEVVKKNLSLHGPFAATEILLMEAVKKGANRQEFHEILRENSLKAFDAMEKQGVNPLLELLQNDPRVLDFFTKEEIKKLLNPEKHLGLAPQRCKAFIKKVRNELSG